MNEKILNKVIVEVIEERERQNQLWGVQRHDYNWWMSILMEEVGEAAEEINNYNFSDGPLSDVGREALFNLRKEMTQVAAVAVAIVEHLEEEGY